MSLLTAVSYYSHISHHLTAENRAFVGQKKKKKNLTKLLINLEVEPFSAVNFYATQCNGKVVKNRIHDREYVSVKWF